MSAGAFSDDDVVKAAGKIVTIMVTYRTDDYNTHGPKFGVKSFPTVLFLDSEGEKVDNLKSRGAKDVAKQINDIADKYNKKDKGKK